MEDTRQKNGMRNGRRGIGRTNLKCNEGNEQKSILNRMFNYPTTCLRDSLYNNCWNPRTCGSFPMTWFLHYFDIRTLELMDEMRPVWHRHSAAGGHVYGTHKAKDYVRPTIIKQEKEGVLFRIRNDVDRGSDLSLPF